MKKILSIIIIIVLSTILGLSYNISTNLSLRLLEADDDVRPLREDLNYNFELIDDLFDDVSEVEFNYLNGVTSAIQTQLNAKQPLDAQLTDVAGLAVTDGGIIVGDGTNFVLETGATARASLGLTIGTHVQAYDAGLQSIAGLTTSANDMIYTTALDTYAIMDTFAELQAVVADKTLINEEDIFTIDANWVNTTNPWADNEVADDLTITAADTTDTTCWVALWETITGAQKLKSDAALTYNAGTGVLTSTGFAGNLLGNVTGALTGNADTVTTNANLTGIVTSVGNATAIANKAIAIAKLADGTDGELITWDASGVIATVAVGTIGHVLTSGGVGVAPTFQAGGAGYSNLTEFVDQTAWRLFYSNTDGHVVELALGTDGQYLKSTGVGSAPEFDTPAGAGEANTASNVGENVEIYKQKTDVDLELRTLKADSNKIIVSSTPAPIDMGEETIHRTGDSLPANYTGIAAKNPADASGVIKTIEIWAGQTLSNCWVATFYKENGNNFTTRDTEEIGTVTGGSKQTKTVNLTVEIGDYIGLTFTGGWLETDTSGGDGFWHLSGDYIPCSNELFTWFYTNDAMSFHGISDETPLDYIKFDIVEENIRIDDLKETEDNTDLNASTTKHGLMPKLPFSGDLLSTTTVAFNADADTTLYTVPTGKRCILSHAMVVAADDAGATTTVSIGANGAETDFIPANTLSNLDAQYDAVILIPIPNVIPLKIKSYAATTVIEAQVASQSGVAGNTIYLFGILY